MATTVAAPPLAGVRRKYERGVGSWLATTDHKKIGQLYLYTALAWFLVGGIEAWMIRWQLREPNGDFVSAETYNQLFTMHGTTMIFLAIMPLSAAFFNYLIPLQIGARDVAFPRLNAFSYWVFLAGSLFINASWLLGAAPDGGWFGYAPLTTRAYSPGLNIDFWVLGLQILGVSSLAASFNFITTVVNMRAPGMHFMRLPIFTWAAFITQFLIALSFPFITVAVTFLGFGVWAHHMFAVGMGPIADSIFGITTMLIAIPTGVKIFNWLGTMWGGSIRFSTACLFAIGLVALFTIGGISGVMHSSVPADLAQTDSYFVVAHFHYVLFGGSMMGLFAGIYYYFPKITGRMMDERLGKLHFWITFIGLNLTFFPMHFVGLNGMPRRTWRYDAGQGWELENLVETIGATILAVGVAIFVYNLIRSRRAGAIAGSDPWGAPTLEWTIPSPPPDYNFATIPTVRSRYPLWDLRSPQLTARVPHTKGGEKRTTVEVGGKDTGASFEGPSDSQ